MSRQSLGSSARALQLVGAAGALRSSHPSASAAQLLDAVFGEGLVGESLDFGGGDDPTRSLAWPTTPFGQILAAAFDRGMEPGDWALIDRPEPEVREALLKVWTEDVLPAFTGRYGLQSVIL
jgi:hypothetical protein